MNGIDISNWQAGIIPSALPIDFCICKATEGLGYTDACCDGFVQDCIDNDLLWGFYHFARENEPEQEAEWFYNECLGYFGHGIPVLDYETSNYNNVEWCERFLNRLHELSGVWALLYISASRCGEYENSWIPDVCGLWVAGYPYEMTSFEEAGNMPYSIYPWRFAAIWQFTSSLYLSGYDGRLDGNIAYMDKEAWMKYAGANEAPEPSKTDKSCFQLADEVIAGKWGNGWNRKQALDSAYGDGTYDHVQAIVNQRLS